MSTPSPSLAPARRASFPRVHRLPTRDPQPPFDDELPPAAQARLAAATCLGGPGQHALTLAFALPGGLPTVPELPHPLRAEPGRAPDLRLVPSPAEPPAEPTRPRRRPVRDTGDDEFGPQSTPRAQLPEPTPWAGRLVQGLLEVLGGVRPASQLVRWTTTEVYDSVQHRITHASIETRTGAPRRLAEVVRSVHVSEPADGVAEICAIVSQGPRCRAVALRLEGVDGRWQCTALQIG
jgi:Family of unknown function (DUF6459)